MRTKSVSVGRRRSITPSVTPSASPIPLLSTAQDNHNATVYDSDSTGNHTHAAALPNFVPDSEPPDSLDDNSCITCNRAGGPLLVCTQTDCPVVVHVTCIGSEPKFDDSGNFFCPYCSYKRALKRTRELREKAILAKKALSSFLEKGQTVRKDDDEEEEHIAEPEPVQPVRDEPNSNEPEPVQGEPNRNEPEPVQPVQDEPDVSDSEERRELNCNENDKVEDKGKVSVSGSSVSEAKNSDSNSVSVKKGQANANAKGKRKVAYVKKSLLPERKTGGAGGGSGDGDGVDEEEVTSSRTFSVQRSKQNLITGKRRRLLWTDEEEKALKEGVLKYSTEKQNIPWRKILEFGCRVFDKTRTPVDLKDKWKNIISKEGYK